jgi:hypothetical protein
MSCSHSDLCTGHNRRWAPWQYVILIIPVVLYFLELPQDSPRMHTNAATRLNRDEDARPSPPNAKQQLAIAHLAGSVIVPAFKKSRRPYRLALSELQAIARAPDSRDDWDGQKVVVEGQLRHLPSSDREFVLFRLQANCGADGVTPQAFIIAPEPLQFQDMEWVEVEGELSFRKLSNRDSWAPVIRVESLDKIKKKTPPNEASTDD